MKNINLDSVKRAFQQWRSQRHNSAEPIPDMLWDMAISLFPKHKRSSICQQLGLSGGQFKKRLEQSESKSAIKTGFVLATTNANNNRIPPSASSDVQISISGNRTLIISAGVHDICHMMPYIGNLL